MLNHEIWKSRRRKIPKHVKPSKNTKQYLLYDIQICLLTILLEKQHRQVKWNGTVPGTVQCTTSALVELVMELLTVPENWSCVRVALCYDVVHGVFLCRNCVVSPMLCISPPNHWALPIVEEVENGRIRRRMLDINRARAFHLLPAIKHFLCWWWITDWLDTGQMDEDKCFCSFLLFCSHFNQFCRFVLI